MGKLKAYTELLKTQFSGGLLVTISHEIFVQNYSNFDTKRQMAKKDICLVVP